MEIKTKLIEFIAENFMVEVEEIPMDKSLIDEGIIDSFGLVEIAAYIKNNYKIETKPEEMVRDNFGSIEKITDFIEKRYKD